MVCIIFSRQESAELQEQVKKVWQLLNFLVVLFWQITLSYFAIQADIV